jgi:fibronectin-binding autotransporter adhesin
MHLHSVQRNETRDHPRFGPDQMLRRHAFGDVDPSATLAFAGSSGFAVAGLPIAKNAALVEAGLDLAISQSATLGVSYTGQLAEDAQDHAFKGVLAVRF